MFRVNRDAKRALELHEQLNSARLGRRDLAKLGLIAGITGAVAVLPAGILLKLSGAPATLWYGAILFGAHIAST